jgi:hypothetical protein
MYTQQRADYTTNGGHFSIHQAKQNNLHDDALYGGVTTVVTVASAVGVAAAKTLLQSRNTGNSEWKARKTDLKQLAARSDYTNDTTLTAEEIYGTNASGASRIPAATFANKAMKLAPVQTSEADARANFVRYMTTNTAYVPLDSVGDIVEFLTFEDTIGSSHEITEYVQIKVTAATTDATGSTTYQWKLLHDQDVEDTFVVGTYSNTIPTHTGLSGNIEGTVTVTGENIVELNIATPLRRMHPNGIDKEWYVYKFYLGGVTGGSITTTTESGSSGSGSGSATGGGDPFIEPFLS